MENNLKKKIENYWYYYKIHTFAAIFLIVVIIVSITSAIGNKKSVLNVDLVGNTINDTEMAKLQDNFTSVLVKDPKKTVNISFLQYDNSPKADMQMNSAVISKIMASTASNDLDIIILDKDLFDNYVKQGMFQRIDEINELGDLSQDNIKYVDGKKNDDKEEYHYGIDVSDNDMLKGTKYNTDNKVLCIVSNSNRKGISSKFTKMLLKLK